MKQRFNPPPNWPPPPQGWQPPPGWQKPPDWPDPPPGWRLWVKKPASQVKVAVITVTVAVLAIGLVVGGGVLIPIAAEPAPTSTSKPAKSEPSEPSEPAEESAEQPTAEPTKEEAKPEPVRYERITQREWKKIAKDPDAHQGDTIIVYGEVFQFDAATGPDTFLADVGGVRDSCAYDVCTYPTTTYLEGYDADLSDLVEGDVFRAKVKVDGTMSYETQVGGETTVPYLTVAKVKVL